MSCKQVGHFALHVPNQCLGQTLVLFRSAEKMRAGVPLTDADRWPWLQALADIIHANLSAGKRMVMACSALKVAYRNLLSREHTDDITYVSPSTSTRPECNYSATCANEFIPSIHDLAILQQYSLWNE